MWNDTLPDPMSLTEAATSPNGSVFLILITIIAVLVIYAIVELATAEPLDVSQRPTDDG